MGGEQRWEIFSFGLVCNSEMDCSSHLFLQCPVAGQVQSLVFNLFKMTTVSKLLRRFDIPFLTAYAGVYGRKETSN